jgi:predicted chitinase
MDKEQLKWMGGALGLFLLILVVIELLFQQKAKRYIVACGKTFGDLDPIQKDSIKLILRTFDIYGDKDKNKLAYILATAEHECSFRPIEEHRTYSARQEAYWYTGYYGRGFVQLTHERNYLKMSNLLGVDFVKNPHLVLKPEYAARILVQGMMEGSFTRKALGRYINVGEQDYFNARRVVNGTDRAERIQNATLFLLSYL